MTRLWLKIFVLIFGIGVATGIIIEFEFGTNLATTLYTLLYISHLNDKFRSNTLLLLPLVVTPAIANIPRI